MKILKTVSILFIIIIAVAIISHAQEPKSAAAGDLTGNYPGPKVIALQGRSISGTAPTSGQVLKWNGTAWEPAADTAAPTTPIVKPSVRYFNQSNGVSMTSAFSSKETIPGLDNQSFTLPQNSRVVVHTVINAYTFSTAYIAQDAGTGAQLMVEILSPTNAIMARFTTDTWLAFNIEQVINAGGVAILPAGTYRTRVSIIRAQGGAELYVSMPGLSSHPDQGGQIIIEIIPD